MIYHANSNQKSRSRYINFRLRRIQSKRSYQGKRMALHNDRGLILQEDITVLNAYMPKNRVSKYVRENLIELQGGRDESAVTVGDFNISLSEMDRYSRHKISKEVVELNNTIIQLDIMDIYRLSHLRTAEYIYFSSLQGTFTKIDHILGYKIHLNKFKSIEII